MIIKPKFIVLILFWGSLAYGQSDKCDSSPELLVFGDCRPTEGNTRGLTDFSIENSCDGITDDDGWFRFKAISPLTLIRIFSDQDVEMGATIFVNCNTEIICMDGTEPGRDGSLQLETIPGEIYFIQVYDVREGGGSFLICVTSDAEVEESSQSDCEEAQVICKDDVILFDPVGPGKDDFALEDNHAGCLQSKENRSAWYYFEINKNAPPNLDLSFVISPEDETDYDFAVFGPNVDCEALGYPVRCSWAAINCAFCPQTGLGMGAKDAGEDAMGDGMVAPLIVQPGEGFFLLVDNYFNNTTGFALRWGGAAAPFLNCEAEVPCGIFAEAGGPIFVCEETEIQLSGSIRGASGDVAFYWEDPAGMSSGFSQADISRPVLNIPREFSGSQNYFLTVRAEECAHTDVLIIQKDCELQDSINCNEIHNAHFDLTLPTCLSPNSGRIQAGVVEGGSPPYLYQMEGKPFQFEATFPNLEAGSYLFSIRDSKGCQLDTLLELGVMTPIALDLGPDIEMDQGDTVEIGINSSIALKAIQEIQWSEKVAIPCDAPCMMAHFAPISSVELSATIRTTAGCEIQDKLQIKVNERTNIYLPSAFSPNGDGINDHFTVFGDSGIKIIRTFKVLDRWGNLVFTRDNFNVNEENLGWDGSFEKQLSSPGIYLYMAELELIDQSLVTKAGEVLLIR